MHELTDVEDEASTSDKHGKQGNMYGMFNVQYITPKVFLRVQDEHGVISMCIYFRYLAICITLIAKSVCIYFRYLAVCITLIAKSICIYFRFLAVNITLIDIFLCTLLHLAGYFLILFLEEILVESNFTG
jgi:hypothetical protein